MSVLNISILAGALVFLLFLFVMSHYSGERIDLEGRHTRGDVEQKVYGREKSLMVSRSRFGKAYTSLTGETGITYRIRRMAGLFGIDLYELQEKIELVGMEDRTSAIEIVAMKILGLLSLPVIGIPAMMSANILYVLIAFLIFLSLFSLPQAKVRGAEKEREDAIIRSLPVFIEQVYMCIEAGSNLYDALMLVSEKSKNALGEVFLKAFRNAEVSGSWTKEFVEAGKVLDMDAFTDFVNNVVVAHQKGIDISGALRAEVNHINAIRRARIRANTSELEAKLVLPMAAFCFLPMMALAVLPPMIAALSML